MLFSYKLLYFQLFLILTKVIVNHCGIKSKRRGDKMFTPVDKRYKVLVIYLYGREIEFETDMDVIQVQEQGNEYIELEGGRHIDLTNIERIIVATDG